MVVKSISIPCPTTSHSLSPLPLTPPSSPPLTSPTQSDVSFTSGADTSSDKRHSNLGLYKPSLPSPSSSNDPTANLVPYISTSTASMPRSDHASTQTQDSPRHSVSSVHSDTSSASTVRPLEEDEEFSLHLESFAQVTNDNHTNLTNTCSAYNYNNHHSTINNNSNTSNTNNIHQFTKSSPCTPVSQLYQNHRNNNTVGNNRTIDQQLKINKQLPLDSNNSNSNSNSNSSNMQMKQRTRPRSQPQYGLRSITKSYQEQEQTQQKQRQKLRPVSHPVESVRQNSHHNSPMLIEPISTGRLPKARCFVRREELLCTSRCLSDLTRAPPDYSVSCSVPSSTTNPNQNKHSNENENYTQNNTINRRQRIAYPTTRLRTDLTDATSYLAQDRDMIAVWMPPPDELQDWSPNNDKHDTNNKMNNNHQDDDDVHFDPDLSEHSFTSSSFDGFKVNSQQFSRNRFQANTKRSTSNTKSRTSNTDSNNNDSGIVNDPKWATSLRNLAGMASRGRDRSPPCIRGSVLEVQPPTLYERFGLTSLSNNKKGKQVSQNNQPARISRPRAKTDGVLDEQPNQLQVQNNLVIPNVHHAQHNLPIRTAAAVGARGSLQDAVKRNDAYVGFMIDSPQQKRPRRWFRFFRRSRHAKF